MDPVSPAELVSTMDDQLPSLLSMFIDGLPLLQQSKYVHEAENRLQQYVKRHKHEDAKSLDSYCRLGLSWVSYILPGIISVDRLVAMAIVNALLFIVDDFFFDTPNKSSGHSEYGINQDARESPPKIQEYLNHLAAVFSQQVQPRNPAPLIGTLMWESGRDVLELSNPEWFRNYVASIMECHRATVAGRADIVLGHYSSLWDLESYTPLRVVTAGGVFTLMQIEFANNSYISSELKATPYFENVTMAASIQGGFVNDIFSYHKESSLEQNPSNLITILMECEGKPFVQTVHRAIGLVNAQARALVDLESEAWNSTLQDYLQDVKAFMTGNLYYSFMDQRYRHLDSVFPELRDMTGNWKILPYAKGLKF